MATNFSDKEPNGTTVIGKTLYQVYILETPAGCGILWRFALVGPRGSCYVVTDRGPKYLLNSVCYGGGVSWRAQPRPLRGLDRKHLALFTGEQAAERIAG